MEPILKAEKCSSEGKALRIWWRNSSRLLCFVFGLRSLTQGIGSTDSRRLNNDDSYWYQQLMNLLISVLNIHLEYLDRRGFRTMLDRLIFTMSRSVPRKGKKDMLTRDIVSQTMNTYSSNR